MININWNISINKYREILIKEYNKRIWKWNWNRNSYNIYCVWDAGWQANFKMDKEIVFCTSLQIYSYSEIFMQNDLIAATVPMIGFPKWTNNLPNRTPTICPPNLHPANQSKLSGPAWQRKVHKRNQPSDDWPPGNKDSIIHLKIYSNKLKEIIEIEIKK